MYILYYSMFHLTLFCLIMPYKESSVNDNVHKNLRKLKFQRIFDGME